MDQLIDQQLPINRTMPSCSIIPELGYEDVGKAIEWLCKTFGFSERWRVGSHRAQLAFGNGAIVVRERPEPRGSGDTATSIPDDPSLSVRPLTQSYSILVRVPDVDAHYGRVRRQGVAVLQPPADYPYGERQYNVVDIGGYQWTFSQSIADLAPEDWGGTSAGSGL